MARELILATAFKRDARKHYLELVSTAWYMILIYLKSIKTML